MKIIIRIELIVLVIASLLLSGQLFAFDPLRVQFPDTPAPPGSQWTWVGRQMVVDGTPMSIKTFDFPGSEADMISHFENFWKTLGHGAYRRNKIGPKSFITHETSDFYTTVQYEVKNGLISGAITVSTPSLSKVKPGKLLVKTPPGAKIVSRIESNDLGLLSESITLLSTKSVKFNTNYYTNQLQNAGWVRVNQHCGSTACESQYQSQFGQLQISIKDLPGNNGNSSRILFHLIKQ